MYVIPRIHQPDLCSLEHFMGEVFDRRTYHLQIEEAAFTDVPAS